MYRLAYALILLSAMKLRCGLGSFDGTCCNGIRTSLTPSSFDFNVFPNAMSGITKVADFDLPTSSLTMSMLCG